MRVLITGGAGFIGSHLAERLVRDEHEVWVLDDLSTGSIRNIDALTGFPNFHYRVGSVTDELIVWRSQDALVGTAQARLEFAFRQATVYSFSMQAT